VSDRAVGCSMKGMRRSLLPAAALVCLVGAACATPVRPQAAPRTPHPHRSAHVRSRTPDPVVATPSDSPSGSQRFSGSIAHVDPEMRRELIEKNWHPGCPVPISQLRVVTVSYWGFDGVVKQGPLVLNERVAQGVLWVFQRLFRARFPIKRIALAGKWHPPRPSDRFTKTDVTASFSCRPVTDGTVLSQHSYGWAIDINPLQNPYIGTDGKIRRIAERPYIHRTKRLPGMIHPGDVVVRSFARIGWGWGGDWTSLKDYMHFSLTGR
jgi:hypothetical protein